MRKRLRVFAIVAMAFALLVSACGDDDGGSEGGAIAENVDLDGIELTVGSKDFTEQLVLGYIMVHGFEAAGADVTDRVDTGGTVVARQALETGEIDVYMEYNGTGWTVHLGQEDPSFDPEQLTEDVRALDLEENNIHWIGKSPFNDTYGFATGPDLTDEHGGAFTMQEMADYLAANPDATVCMESEFPSRPDGLVLFEDYTGYEVPDSQQEILDTNIIYNETAEGNCDFGEIFTTDGRIPALDLSIVEDPDVMIVYNVSLTMRDETYSQAPEEFDEFADLILEGLDEDTMAELNRRVSVEGEDPDDVALDYLVSEGLIAG
jgi:osmoprotectant transport system substrate-binding protein